MDIILLGDYSGSIAGKEQLVQNAFLQFSKSFKYSASVRIGVVLFSGDSEIILPLTRSDNRLVQNKIATISEYIVEGNTNMTTALETTYIILTQDRELSRKTIIVISDGEVDNGETVLNAVQIIKQKGIIICSIHISHLTTEIVRNDVLASRRAHGKKLMKEISSGENYFTQTNYNNLSEALKVYGPCM